MNREDQREALEPWAQVFHDRLGNQTFGGQIPEQTCPECDSNDLTDFDMDEDEDGRQWGTFRCRTCGFPKASGPVEPTEKEEPPSWTNQA